MYCRRCAAIHEDKVCPATGRRIDIVKDEQDDGSADALIRLDDDGGNQAVGSAGGDGGALNVALFEKVGREQMAEIVKESVWPDFGDAYDRFR